MKITRNEIKKILKEMETVEVKTAKCSNCESQYKRIIIDNVEFTFALDECNGRIGRLYVGKVGDTVAAVKEGRREGTGPWVFSDRPRVRYASLVAQLMEDNRIFYTIGSPLVIE